MMKMMMMIKMIMNDDFDPAGNMQWMVLENIDQYPPHPHRLLVWACTESIGRIAMAC